MLSVSTESDATLGVLTQLRAQGLRCPDDVSLIGIDDAPWSAVTAPALTVYQQPAYEMGRRSARLLLQRLADDESPHATHRLTGRLVSRDSVGPAPEH